MPSNEQIGIYLNDHLGGSVAGRDLAESIRKQHEGTALGEAMAPIVREIEEDQEKLSTFMRQLGVGESKVKVVAGSTLQKLSSLVFELGVEGDSPLNRFLEVEALLMGVNGKRELWLALQEAAAHRPDWPELDLRALIERADKQLQELERHRLQLAVAAFAG
ncbi:MAG: hypothetical protein M3072_08825 [Candidatus Dormibacteraeota bacterium]|nr:hypothetical protein [Candidatus Dormibacteraeota bacterium]